MVVVVVVLASASASVAGRFVPRAGIAAIVIVVVVEGQRQIERQRE